MPPGSIIFSIGAAAEAPTALVDEKAKFNHLFDAGAYTVNASYSAAASLPLTYAKNTYAGVTFVGDLHPGAFH